MPPSGRRFLRTGNSSGRGDDVDSYSLFHIKDDLDSPRKSSSSFRPSRGLLAASFLLVLTFIIVGSHIYTRSRNSPSPDRIADGQTKPQQQDNGEDSGKKEKTWTEVVLKGWKADLKVVFVVHGPFELSRNTSLLYNLRDSLAHYVEIAVTKGQGDPGLLILAYDLGFTVGNDLAVELLRRRNPDIVIGDLRPRRRDTWTLPTDPDFAVAQNAREYEGYQSHGLKAVLVRPVGDIPDDVAHTAWAGQFTKDRPFIVCYDGSLRDLRDATYMWTALEDFAREGAVPFVFRMFVFPRQLHVAKAWFDVNGHGVPYDLHVFEYNARYENLSLCDVGLAPHVEKGPDCNAPRASSFLQLGVPLLIAKCVGLDEIIGPDPDAAGLVVKNKTDWLRHIKAVATEPKLRIRLSESSRTYALQHAAGPVEGMILARYVFETFAARLPRPFFV